jgi:hypothetical protein
MRFFAQFRTYFMWSLEFPFAAEFRVPTILLIANLLLALAFSREELRNGWKRSCWLVFSNLLLFPAVVAAGAIFSVDPKPHLVTKVSGLGEWTLDAILLLSALAGAYCIYVMRGLRWLALSILLLEEYLLFGAMFIAGMAISGDWL